MSEFLNAQLAPGVVDEGAVVEGGEDTTRFPIEAFPPGAFTAMAAAVSAAYPVAQELPYLVALSAVTALLGRRVRATSDWWAFETPPNLLIIASARTGSGKTLAVRPFLQVLLKLQREVDARWTQKRDSLSVERKQLERSCRGGSKPNHSSLAQKSSGSESERRLVEIEHQLNTPRPRWIDTSPTPEALPISMGSWDGCGYLLASEAEPTVQILLGEMRNGVPAFGTFCGLFSGDLASGSRVGREIKSVEDPRLSAFLAAQPDKVESLRINDEARVRGLVGRCLWAKVSSTPDIDPNAKGEVIAAEVLTAFEHAVRDLFARFCDPDSQKSESLVRISEVAGHRLNVLRAETQKNSRESDTFAQLYNRRCEQAIKIAMGLHAMRYGVDLSDHEISLETVQQALRLLDWFNAPWQADDAETYVDERAQAVEKLLKLIQNGEVDGSRVTLREFYRRLNMPVAKAREHVKSLVDDGLVYELPSEPGSRTVYYDFSDLLGD